MTVDGTTISNDDDDGDHNVGAIVGTVVGCVVGAIVVITALLITG